MKNMVWSIAILLCLMACKQEPGYKITANITGMPDGLKVYMEDQNSQVLDSTVTKDGCFIFEGKVETPFYGGILVKNPEGERFSGREFNMFFENSEISVESQWDDFYNMTITGSALQDEYAKFEEQLSPLRDKLNGGLAEQHWMVYNQYLYENKFAAEHIKPGMDVARQQNEITRQIWQVMIDFIKTHSNSPVALNVLEDLLGYSSTFTVDEIAEWTEFLAPKLKQTEVYKALEKKIAIYKETAKGEKFIDFRVVDMDGNEGMFSDYVQPGKYNLLEVWASWCGHCRVEIPHLKIVREKYGDRFNIIAVSCDKNDTEWRKAMNEDNPNYLQLRAVEDDKGKDVGNYYRLIGIPYSLVIDGEGRIVTRDGRGAKLDVLLEEQYGQIEIK